MNLENLLVLSGEDARQTTRPLLVICRFRHLQMSPLVCHLIEPGPVEGFPPPFLTGRPRGHRFEVGPAGQAVPSVRRPSTPTRRTRLGVNTSLLTLGHGALSGILIVARARVLATP